MSISAHLIISSTVSRVMALTLAYLIIQHHLILSHNFQFSHLMGLVAFTGLNKQIPRKLNHSNLLKLEKYNTTLNINSFEHVSFRNCEVIARVRRG